MDSRTYNEDLRLAWFSPLPPVRTGLSVDSRALLSPARRHPRNRRVRGRSGRAAARRLNRLPESVAIRPAHDFAWRQRRAPYDLTVFQLGNSAHHAYQWPYLFRHPGLLVLHDGHLHHSRAASLMRQRRHDHYRAEFAACQPDTSVDAAELAIAGFDSHLYYYWPFTRLAVGASKVTARAHPRAPGRSRGRVAGRARRIRPPGPRHAAVPGRGLPAAAPRCAPGTASPPTPSCSAVSAG